MSVSTGPADLVKSPPILLVIFNRPELVRQVLEALSGWDIPTLYIAADGPRPDRPDDFERCREARDVAISMSRKWQSRVLFHGQNLGSGRAVASAIDWFFQHEESGIILEDDCVPNYTFGQFCSELLDRFQDDSQIMMISGNNLLEGRSFRDQSYSFIRHPHTWGWATWRRAWVCFDYEMRQWPMLRTSSWLLGVCRGDRKAELYWRRTFDLAAAQRSDIWDYQWTFCVWLYGGLSVMPRINLVHNIGFGSNATHTAAAPSWYSKVVTGPIEFPLTHPLAVQADLHAERFTDLEIFQVQESAFLHRVFGRLKRVLTERFLSLRNARRRQRTQ